MSNLLRHFSNNERIRLSILNYSAQKNDLLTEFTKWLNVPSSVFSLPPTKLINRSLTRSELELQRNLNKILGEESRILSNAFCEKIPELELDQISFPMEKQKLMCRRLYESMNDVNSHVGNKNKYADDFKECKVHEGDFKFSEKQISVISSVLGGEIQRLKERYNQALEHLDKQKELCDELSSNYKFLSFDYEKSMKKIQNITDEKKNLESEIANLSRKIKKIKKTPIRYTLSVYQKKIKKIYKKLF